MIQKHRKKLLNPVGRNSGMSIIETLIFIAIISIVLVSLTGITASMTRQMRINYNKIYATHYAEELADWLRVQKDVVGWTNYYNRSFYGVTPPAIGPGATYTKSYCINSPVNLNSVYALSGANAILTTSGTCSTYTGITGSAIAPRIYKRYVTFSQDCSATSCTNARGVRAKISVKWIEAGGKEFSVEINTIYAPL